MSRYKIHVEYEGTNLVGWQRQKNGISVQEILENALFKLTGEKKIVQGAGRTDAGVHALNQVAHFDIIKKIKTDAIRDGLNFHIKNLYKKVMTGQSFEFQKELKNRKKITWLVSLLSSNREKLIDTFKNNGVDARPFFFTLSSMNIYKKYSSKVNPIAQKISNFGISLPTYESLKSLKEIEKK